jgi:bifunctional non-homologous end joining protein LigD
MKTHLVVFDVLEAAGNSLLNDSFRKRAGLLGGVESLIARDRLGKQLIVDRPFWPRTLHELRNFISTARNNNEEGIVARIGSSVYTVGRPNSGGTCLRLKFTGMNTVRVSSVHKTKRSIGIEVDGNVLAIPVGNCTVTEAVHKTITVGDLVEIEYLHAYRKGSLFQPRFKGLRPDKTLTDLHSSLKFKD